MAHKRLKPARPAASAPIESQVRAAARLAERLIQDDQFDEAWRHLEDLHRRFPTRKEPLQLMLELAIDADEMHYTEDVLERLVRIAPKSPDYAVALAGASLSNGYMALARERFEHFIEQWPHHHEAAHARKTLEVLESELSRMMDEAGLRQENRFYLSARNEAIQSLNARKRYKEAQQFAKKTLETDGFFAPAANNLTLSYLFDGNYSEAATSAQRVLEVEPDNVHALSNLAHALYVLGRFEEASQIAVRLKTSKAFAADRSAKVIETLSFLGDDEGVLDIYRQSQAHPEDPSFELPVVHHLAGAAAMRLGREAEARGYWNAALKLDPEFTLALGNLADLKRPVGERNGPWAFPLNHWIKQDIILGLATRVESTAKRERDTAVEKAVAEALQEFPYLETVVPILLERGDPGGKMFALLIARNAKTPSMIEALRVFALSQNGTDEMRLEVANFVSREQGLEGGTVKMWLQGKWTDIILLGWEIHEEVDGEHSEQVEDLVREAHGAIRKGDGIQAEDLLKQALKAEPDSPTLLFNLAMAYQVQQRREDSAHLVREIYERFPDYLFGIVGVADLIREEGDLERAEDLLTPLLTRTRLHISEFVALAKAYIDLMLAKADMEGARRWLAILKQTAPDHPAVDHYTRLLENPLLRPLELLQSAFKRRKR